MVTSSDCPCDLPCIRFFDSINNCRGLENGGLLARSNPDTDNEDPNQATPSSPISHVMKDAPLQGTTSSLIECNFFDNELFCTVIPDGNGNYESDWRNGRSNPPPAESNPSSGKVGRVKCEEIESKPQCNFVWE